MDSLPEFFLSEHFLPERLLSVSFPSGMLSFSLVSFSCFLILPEHVLPIRFYFRNAIFPSDKLFSLLINCFFLPERCFSFRKYVVSFRIDVFPSGTLLFRLAFPELFQNVLLYKAGTRFVMS